METATWNEACQREALALPGHAADELKQQRDVGARDHSAQADAVRKITERFLSRSTAKERLLYDALSAPDSRFQPICRHLTLQDCAQDPQNHVGKACEAVHFEPMIHPHTDPSRGHCSYLNTCHRSHRCRYLHFRPVRRPDATPFVWSTHYDDDPMPLRTEVPQLTAGIEGNLYGYSQAPLAEDERRYLEAPLRHPSRALHARKLDHWIRHPQQEVEATEPDGGGDDVLPAADTHCELMAPQWIDADLKNFDYSVLGKFDVIVADPPWDIHMSLPYGTMSDDDMRSMPFPLLQDEGFLFLWVTGRAMELGRELLAFWGYTRIDEIVWIKVGQTQRLIRTGRTGHWLNHTKEHCLVGVKTRANGKADKDAGSRVSPLAALSVTYPASHAPGIPRSTLLPSWANAGLDTDVIVAEVRDTSRKPDELYSMIERLCPHGRNVELFGRRHNARPGWLTVGNQLKGDCILDEALAHRVDAWRRSRQQRSRQQPPQLTT